MEEGKRRGRGRACINKLWTTHAQYSTYSTPPTAGSGGGVGKGERIEYIHTTYPQSRGEPAQCVYLCSVFCHLRCRAYVEKSTKVQLQEALE